MGLGDDIMFLGEAESLYKKIGKKITPVYGSGWSALFENVEFLTKTGGVTLNARDSKQKSDYHVDYYVKNKRQTILGEKLEFFNYKPKRFAVRLTNEEKNSAKEIVKDLGEFMVINPDYKSAFFTSNKDWGFEKYQKVVDEISKYINVVRIKPGGKYTEPDLKNAINISCPDLRQQIAIWSLAKFGLSYDGLMVHVLSGFNIPVVNIMGGLVSPDVMSYPNNINLYYEHHMTPCGSTFDCAHCYQANQYITVDKVLEACQKFL